MKTSILTFFCIFLLSCNVNPNKEARLQTLETEVQVLNDDIKSLNDQVEALTRTNQKLNQRLTALEKNK